MIKNSTWRSNLIFLLISYLYWYLLCLFDRSVFLISNWDKIDDTSDILYAYVYGFRMDMSLVSYVLVLPFLFFIIQILFIKKAFSPWILRVYTFLPTFVFAAITVVNIPLYASWGEKISKRAILLGAGTVGGVTSSVDFGMIVQAIIILVAFFTLAHYTYHLLLVKVAKYKSHSIWLSIISLLIGAVVLFTFIRGGYGRATMNPSAVYFSDNTTSNHLAVNTYWAFLKDMTKSAKKNPYEFMPIDEAEKLTALVLPSGQDTVERISKVEKPNVVLVLLEGMVAQVFEDLGGEKEVSPNMTKLMREGVNFTRAYAAADRSDKGMIAVMSGFPAQGTESIIQYIPKHEKLPAIGQIYDSLGYSTSFYHGGQSEFYNFKSYMYTHGIERVVDNANFRIDTKRNSWGVYDHVIAARMLSDLSKEKKPFFSVFYTLINHEPFNLHDGYHFGNDTKGNAYRSTSYYTDTMLNNFVEEAKKQDWYANTLFVVVSDHGSLHPTGKFGLEHPNRFHIPLFIFGGALKDEYKGKKVDAVVSQLDVASTLWNLVADRPSPFKYSTDLFAKNRNHLAFFNSNSTFGIVGDDLSVSYDLLGKKVAFIDPSGIRSEEPLRIAKAYFQTVFKDFQSF